MNNKILNLCKKNYQYIFLSIILLIGAILRFYKISSQSLWMDEGFTVNHVMIFLNGAGLKGNVLNTLIPSFGALLFGENEFGLRFFSVIFGLLTIWISFFLTKNLFPKRKYLPFFVVGFLALSYWQIAWSRQVRMYSFLQFFFIGSQFFIFKIFFQDKLFRQKLAHFIFFIFLTILAILSHKFGLIILPIALLPFFLVENKTKSSWLIILSIFLLAIYCIFQFQIIKNSIFSPVNNIQFYFRFLVDSHYVITALAFLGMSAGFFMSAKNEKKSIIFLIIPILFTFFGLSFFGPLLNYRYLFPIFPLIVILASFFLYVFYEKLNNKLIKLLFLLIITFLLFSSQELIFSPREKYFLESDNSRYTDYRVKTPQSDFKQAHQLIKDNLSEEDILMSTYPEITSFYLGKTDYYLPFDLEYQMEWEDLKVVNRTGTLEITDLYKLHEIIKANHGYVILDAYAQEKLPQEVVGYLEYNTDLFFEKWEEENVDSGVFVYRF